VWSRKFLQQLKWGKIFGGALEGLVVTMIGLRLIKTFFVLLGIAGVAYGRVPANLAGTDIFPAEMKFDVQVKVAQAAEAATAAAGGSLEEASVGGSIRRKQQTLQDITYEAALPTGALNLAAGADFFTMQAQPLWNFGDLVVLQEILNSEGKKCYSSRFLKRWGSDERLEVDAINPLAFLIRSLFWQLPGTQGLADFRVSRGYCVFEEGSVAVDIAKTLDGWAEVIVATMALYDYIGECLAKNKELKEADIRGIFNVTLSLNNVVQIGWNATKDLGLFDLNEDSRFPTLAETMFRCVTWSQENNLGQDYPLRILMGGVYALAGHNQEAIFDFYRKLIEKFCGAKYFKKREKFRADLKLLVLPEHDGLPMPFGSASEASIAAAGQDFQTYRKLINVLAFSPVAYRTAAFRDNHFADCFETTLRNIVLALLQGEDGGLRTGLVIEAVQKFFETFDHSKQSLQEAHNAWAALVSGVEGCLYVRNGTLSFNERYELEPSLIQLMFFLNYIFGLDIKDFDEHVISVDSASWQSNVSFIETVLPQINQGLREKFGVDWDVVAVDNVKLWTDTKSFVGYIKITPQQVQPFSVGIAVKQHAEVIETKREYDNSSTRSADVVEALVVGLSLDTIKSLLDTVLVHNTRGLQRMVYAAASEYAKRDYAVIGLLNIFVERGACYAEASSVASALVGNADIRLRLDVFGLFEELVMREHGYAEAITAASVGVRDTYSSVRLKALHVFKELVIREQAYAEAITAALAGVIDSDAWVRLYALDLFKELFIRKQGYAEAVVAVRDGRASSIQDVCINARNLFSALLVHKDGFNAAIKAGLY
jgi:hypothetical protein